MASFREVERKFEALEGTAVPERLGDELTVAAADELHLDATYYDTEHLRLLHHGATLRYRTGDDEPGWHLKLNAGPDARREIHADGEPGTLPAELLALVRPHAGREVPGPVAELTTTRLQRPVLDRAATPVAVLDDDEVSGRRAADGRVVVWRELEAELAPGTDDTLLEVLATALGATGWAASAGVSKIGRVLTGGADPRDLLPAPTATKAARHLLTHLDNQVKQIVANDASARSGDVDAVHDMRVATRRLRSTLATFRTCFDRTRTDPLRDELKWFAGVLGVLRDDHVLHDRLTAELAELPPELVLGPVAERIRMEMRGREQADLAALVTVLDGDRYLELIDSLHRLLEAPPWQAGRSSDGAEVRAKVLRTAALGALRRVRRSRPKSVAQATDAELHELRKAAKRARYALELLVPIDGDEATAAAARFEAVQEVLGEHQDTIGARDVLRLLGAATPSRGENGFTFGLLHDAERQRALDARAESRTLVRLALKPGHLRWLDD